MKQSTAMVEGRKLHFLTSGARTNDLVYHPLTDRPFDHRNALAIRPTVRASFPLPLPRSHSTTAFNNRSRSRSRVGKKKKRRKIIHRIESLFFLNLLIVRYWIQVQMARGINIENVDFTLFELVRIARLVFMDM